MIRPLSLTQMADPVDTPIGTVAVEHFRPTPGHFWFAIIGELKISSPP
jgi:hypothetical protein